MENVLHRAKDRGHSDRGWLQSNFSFSFADYHDPNKMGFATLRVLNDDTVAAGKGFATHPHRDMEIVSIPTKGKLLHEDTLGNKQVIVVGEVQRMSAGSGIMHSEYASEEGEAKFFQIWIHPKKFDCPPSYEQKNFGDIEGVKLVVSPDGRDGSITIGQDAYFTLAKLSEAYTYKKYQPENGVYAFVIEGNIKLLGEELGKRDAMGIYEDDNLEITTDDGYVLLIEVPFER